MAERNQATNPQSSSSNDRPVPPAVDMVGVPRFLRTFTLSRELDAGRIEANLEDGVLTLRVPKQAHAQPRRVEVTAG